MQIETVILIHVNTKSSNNSNNNSICSKQAPLWTKEYSNKFWLSDSFFVQLSSTVITPKKMQVASSCALYTSSYISTFHRQNHFLILLIKLLIDT